MNSCAARTAGQVYCRISVGPLCVCVCRHICTYVICISILALREQLDKSIAQFLWGVCVRVCMYICTHAIYIFCQSPVGCLCVCVQAYLCIYACICKYVYMDSCAAWTAGHLHCHILLCGGVATVSRIDLIKVSFAKEPYKRYDILQKRPII